MSIVLAEGEAISVTIVYGSAGGRGSSDFKIVRPDGVAHYDTTDSFTTDCRDVGYNPSKVLTF